jgi:hypothetical protein
VFNMTDDIIRDQSKIADASTADILRSYNALTGENVARFSTRTAGERRLAMAILAAQDRTAHAGVPFGTAKIEPKTSEELTGRRGGDSAPAEDAPATAQDAPGAAPDDATQADPSANPFKPGTMAHGLWLAADVASKRSKPAKMTTPGASRPPKVMAVQATFAGKSKCQPDSRRRAVLDFVQGLPEKAATVEQIEAHFAEENVRTHIQKLVAVDHFRVITLEAYAELKVEEAA